MGKRKGKGIIGKSEEKSREGGGGGGGVYNEGLIINKKIAF